MEEEKILMNARAEKLTYRSSVFLEVSLPVRRQFLRKNRGRVGGYKTQYGKRKSI